MLNYKTVVSFGDKNVDAIFEKFSYLMTEPLNNKVKNAHIAGFFFGYSQCCRIVFMGVILYLGTISIRTFGYDTESVYIVIQILLSASMGAGVAISNVPSVGRAKASARNIFAVIDEKSTLDVRDASKSSF